MHEIDQDEFQLVLYEIDQDEVSLVLYEFDKEIYIHNRLIFTIVNDFKDFERLSEIKFNFLNLKDKMFNCKIIVILRGAIAACGRILHLLSEYKALFQWTNNSSDDLILTNNCGDQLVHEQHMLRHTMNENPKKMLSRELTLIRLSMANLPFKPISRLIFLQKKDICRFSLIQSTYFFLKRQILYFLFFDFKFLGYQNDVYFLFLSLSIRRFEKLKKERKIK